MMRRFLALLLAAVLFLANPMDAKAAGKTISASLAEKSVKIGKNIQIQSKTKGVAYHSKDSKIAYVSRDGLITGKKKGTVTISVTKEGYETRRFSVEVKANGKLPAMAAAKDEIVLKQASVTKDDNKKSSVFQASIYNKAKTAVKSVVYTYKIKVLEVIESKNDTQNKNDAQNKNDTQNKPEDSTENSSENSTTQNKPIAEDNTTEEAESTSEQPKEPEYKEVQKTVKLETGKIAAGKKSPLLTCEGPSSGKISDMELVSIKIYAGETVYTYDAAKGKETYGWSVPDKTPPVITGMVGADSYNRDEIFMTVYSDKKFDYSKYVKAEDNRDGAVRITADTSKVNWKKKGQVTITLKAVDKAGNVAKKKARIMVRPVSDLDHMADSILKNIIKDSWSDQKKAEAIYRYVRQHYGYVDSNDHASWEASALYGLRYKSGNCFVYYSVSKLLLTRAGLPNITITRYGGHSGHWWNLVYVKGGWYHFDTTPRRISATFCLLTDKQLTAYSQRAGNSHIWKRDLYPKTATKEISKVHWGRKW